MAAVVRAANFMVELRKVKVKNMKREEADDQIGALDGERGR